MSRVAYLHDILHDQRASEIELWLALYSLEDVSNISLKEFKVLLDLYFSEQDFTCKEDLCEILAKQQFEGIVPNLRSWFAATHDLYQKSRILRQLLRYQLLEVIGPLLDLPSKEDDRINSTLISELSWLLIDERMSFATHEGETKIIKDMPNELINEIQRQLIRKYPELDKFEGQS